MKPSEKQSRFLSTELNGHLKEETFFNEQKQYLELFNNIAFKNFTRHSPLILAVYNFPKQKYEFIGESISELYGVKSEKFTTDSGARIFFEILTSESQELMSNEIIPRMLECCAQHKNQIYNLRFSALLEIRLKNGKGGWLLLQTHILLIDSNGAPVLSYSTGMEVSNIKKDPYIHYSASLSDEGEVTILYCQNKTGTKSNVQFSKREIQIIQYLCKGETTKEIAKKLFLSFDTIKKQRSSILEKSGSRNTAELINFSSMAGII